MEIKDDIEEINSDEGVAVTKKEENSVSSPPLETVKEYSKFTKNDFAELLKELKNDNDFAKVESVLREIKYYINQIQEQEKAVALTRFIELGSDASDFNYRLDALDVSIEADVRYIKKKTSAYFQDLEAKKNDNLKEKELLLAELRKLVESTDNKDVFLKFKDIQRKWNNVGSVPHHNNRVLWGSYHALVELFYDNRNIYFELKELDRKKNYDAKIELCVRAEKIASIENINKAIVELDDLHEQYKRIGPVSKEKKELLWNRFKSATKVIHDRRDSYLSELHKGQLENFDKKVEIAKLVEQFQDFKSDRIADWNKKTIEILELQKKWDAIKRVPHARTKEVSRQFWSAFKLFFKNKGLVVKKTKEFQIQNLELKLKLLQKVEALKDSDDWNETVNEIRQLQVQWKNIGHVPIKESNRIYAEFKAACDYFFNRLRAKSTQNEHDKIENLKNIETLCEKFEKMVSEKVDSIEEVSKLISAINSVGSVPRNSILIVQQRLEKTLSEWINSVSSASEEEKTKIKMELELGRVKTDPDAEMKIQKRIQILRRKISKSENELGTLNNNLEFFSNSKNSEKLKNEFSQKLELAEQKLNKMKQELKLLYGIIKKTL